MLAIGADRGTSCDTHLHHLRVTTAPDPRCAIIRPGTSEAFNGTCMEHSAWRTSEPIPGVHKLLQVAEELAKNLVIGRYSGTLSLSDMTLPPVIYVRRASQLARYTSLPAEPCGHTQPPSKYSGLWTAFTFAPRTIDVRQTSQMHSSVLESHAATASRTLRQLLPRAEYRNLVPIY